MKERPGGRMKAMLCDDCKDLGDCTIRNDLLIITLIHGMGITIDTCPMFVEREQEED